MIDNKLSFSSHINYLCKKVNAKAYLISKSLHLFRFKFRTLLFKLFIVPHFDYCSTLFIYLKKSSDKDRLSRCFNKCVYRLLNKNIFSLTEFEQLKILYNELNIFPLIYRQLFHFLCFLYKLIIRKNCNIILKKFFISAYNCSSITRNTYVLPTIKSDFKKYSFSSISLKILNLFMHKFICDKLNKTEKLSIKKFLTSKINNDFNELYSFIT